MSALAISDITEREATYRRGEQLVRHAAEAERVAFVHWQEAYGAYEVACDEASVAWTAWIEAVTP
ncbi:MAG TPA: hypothetical protein VHH53_03110 [Pseudonocardiaceae bacterium]|nr:hypothetical protein [Pseudonocardiaceae bacterium]